MLNLTGGKLIATLYYYRITLRFAFRRHLIVFTAVHVLSPNEQTYWQKRILTLAEKWSNTKMEQTDIYGLRRYNEGARLITHIDRIATHAVGIIVNIVQVRTNSCIFIKTVYRI